MKKIEYKFHWSNTNFYKNIDIKNIWEMSRWQWFPILAMAWRMSSNEKYIDKIRS